MFEPAKISPLKHAASTIAAARRPRRTIVALASAGFALAAAIAGAVWFTGDSGSGKYLTQRVVRGNVEDSVSALGTLQPLQYVDVGTQVSGQLKKLHVTYGDAVEQGRLLAEIDPVIYQARVNADEAQLLNLQAQIAQRRAERLLAEQQFARQKDLLKENATSQDAYDSADSRLKVTSAQIVALEAQLKQTQSTLNGDTANLGYTKIYAPMAGTVVNLIAKQGQTLNANQTAPIVLRIADLDTMTVWAQVSEADVPKLKLGMPAYFTTLGLAEKRRYGKLRQVMPTPEIVNNVVLYNCLFDVENPDRDLLTQMSAQVFFVVSEARDVPVAPVSALRRAGDSRRDSRFTVQVLEDGELVTREVEVGVMNRLLAEIKSGLKEGDEVVLDVTPVPGGQRQAPPGASGGPRGRP